MSETIEPSCDALAPFIPRMGLSFMCKLKAGHAGDHSAGAIQWPQAPHAAAHQSITTTTTISAGPIQPGAEPTREELIRELGVWKPGTYFKTAADLLEADQVELDALDAEVERQDAEIARLNDLVNRFLTSSDATRQRIAELEALVRVAACPNCDGSGAIVRSVTGIRAACCGRPNRDGSCCGNAVPEPTEEQQVEPCQWCDKRQSLLNKTGEQS